MRIAVLSYTHDHLPSHIAPALAAADEIWHLGDVCDPALLVELGQLGRPLFVVAGNCDAWPAWPLELTLTRAGLICQLVHIPPRRPAPGAHLVLHGHTHVPRDETDPAGVRWLNPGCITRPNRGAPPSYAWLELAPGRVVSWTTVFV